jgi:hypothetical protein
MSNMGLHDPFGHLQHKLWPKERPGVKMVVWFLTTESQESTQFPCVQVACDTSLKSSRQELQLWFKLRPDQRFARKVMVLQSCGTSNFGNFAIQMEKKPFRCHSYGVVQNILYEEGDGFPQVRAMVNLVIPKSPVAFPNTKGAPTMC